jgi:hypothetical protein
LEGASLSAQGPLTVYVLPRHATSWSELIPLARRLKERAGFRVKVVLANEFATGQRGACNEAGLECVDIWNLFKQRTKTVLDRLVSWWTDKVGWCAESLPVALLRYHQMRRQLRHERAILESLLASDNVACVLLPGDRELSPVPAMIGACRRAGCLTIIAASNNPYIESLVLSRAGDRRFSLRPTQFPSMLNFIAASRYPGQVRNSKEYGRVLFSPGWLTLALGAEGVLADNPWAQGGGKSDYASVPSQSKKAAYVALGVPAEKILVIGSIEFDRLFESFLKRESTRDELKRAHGLRNGRPLVVMAVPNEAEHGFCDWPTHLARQECFWRELSAFDMDVVLCLHPKSTKRSYQALADKCGFALSERPLVECLPAADLFACSLSTTIFWAHCCGVPVLNMNYLELSDEIFRRPHGYYEARSPGAFRACIERALANIRSPAVQAVRQQAEIAARDYMFDGASFERLVGVLSELASERATI